MIQSLTRSLSFVFVWRRFRRQLSVTGSGTAGPENRNHHPNADNQDPDAPRAKAQKRNGASFCFVDDCPRPYRNVQFCAFATADSIGADHGTVHANRPLAASAPKIGRHLRMLETKELRSLCRRLVRLLNLVQVDAAPDAVGRPGFVLFAASWASSRCVHIPASRDITQPAEPSRAFPGLGCRTRQGQFAAKSPT